MIIFTKIKIFIKYDVNELWYFLNPGEAVTVEDEVVVISSIVLPNKTLNVGVQDEIIL